MGRRARLTRLGTLSYLKRTVCPAFRCYGSVEQTVQRFYPLNLPSRQCNRRYGLSFVEARVGP